MSLFNEEIIEGEKYSTEALEERAESIIDTLKEGNNWKTANGVLGLASAALLIPAGGGLVSPFIGLLFAGSLASNLVSYVSYCLAEAQALGVKPLWIPLIGGKEASTLSSILTEREEIHWDIIQRLGRAKTRRIEVAGLLDEAIDQLLDIDVSGYPSEQQKRAKAKAEKEILAFFQSATQGNETPQSVRMPAQGNKVRRLVAATQESEDCSEDVWDEDFTPTAVTKPPVVSPPRVASDYLRPSESDSLPPIRDMAREIAECGKHVLLVASTTSGKSTLLSEVLRYANQMEHQIIIIDGKGCRAFALAGVSYRQCNTTERVGAAVKELQVLVDTLNTRIDLHMSTGQTNFTPITVIIDEINIIRSLMDKAQLKEFTDLFRLLLLQGASSKIKLRVSSHSSRLAQLGLDGGEADSLSLVSVGREKGYESIEDMITYHASPRQKDACFEQLHRIHGAQDFKETLCYSHLKSRGFFRLPWLNNLPKAQEAEVNDPVAKLERSWAISGLKDSTSATIESVKKSGEVEVEEDFVSSPIVDALSDAELDDVMAKILAYAKKTGRTSPSSVTNNNRAFRHYSADDVYRIFSFLVQEGEGKLDKRTFIPNDR